MLVSRFEIKYLIPETIAEEISARLPFYMEPDAHWRGTPERGYTIHSLYYDSVARMCYFATKHGEKNRFKLRVRWYGEDDWVADGALFLEEKRRTNQAISKTRVRLRPEALDSLRRGAELSAEMLAPKADPAEAAMLADKIRGLAAAPTCHIRYHRQAWMAAGGSSLRLTFDRDLAVRPVAANGQAEPWCPVPTGPVIFEVKFEQLVPTWIEELVHDLNLRQLSVPKYIDSLDALAAADAVAASGLHDGYREGAALWAN